MTSPLFDPKGLICEAFAIEAIAAPECRSIFLDWALSLPDERDVQTEVRVLLDYYGAREPKDHPMLATLREATQIPLAPRRRGGRKTRVT